MKILKGLYNSYFLNMAPRISIQYTKYVGKQSIKPDEFSIYNVVRGASKAIFVH